MLTALAFATALLVAGWITLKLRRVAATGAAYKAKVLATLVFAAGRPVNPGNEAEVSLDSYRPMRLFRTRIDHRTRTVTVWLPPFAPRVAAYRDDLGASVLRAGAVAADVDPAPEVAPEVTAPPSTAPPSARVPSGGRSSHLDAFVARAFTDEARRRRRTRAVLILRGGEIVAEQYAPGFDEATLFPGWSVTKAVMGTLAGILIGEGRLALGQRALRPEWQPPDPRSAITVEDLLRMRSGLRFNEDYRNLSSDVNEMLFHQPDMAAFAASRQLAAPPGTAWSYSSGTTNILSSVIRHAVGETGYRTLPRRVLFDPVGMTSARMEADASGTFVGSSYMLATARDWARFGQLYLQDGIWEGRRIVPDGWVRFATTPTPQSPGGNWGAHWYLKLNADIGGGTPAAARIRPDAYFAIGHEGQTLTVIPSLQLVVVRLGLSIYIDAWNHAAFIAELQDIVGAG